jgi:hypothetical protein
MLIKPSNSTNATEATAMGRIIKLRMDAIGST